MIKAMVALAALALMSGCVVERGAPVAPRPPPAAPIAAPPAPAPRRVAAPPKLAPSSTARPAACTSELAGPVAAHYTEHRWPGGALERAFQLRPGETLCIEARASGASLSGLKIAGAKAHSERAIQVRLVATGSGDLLRVKNPFSNYMLKFSAEEQPAAGGALKPAVMCPVRPHIEGAQNIAEPAARMVLFNFHLKGVGTAGSNLCE